MHTGTEIPSDCGRVGSWKRAQTEVWCQPVQPGGDHGILHFCKSAISTTFLWTIPTFFHISIALYCIFVKVLFQLLFLFPCSFTFSTIIQFRLNNANWYWPQSKSGHRQILNLQNIHQMFNSQIFIITRLVAVNMVDFYMNILSKKNKILSAYFADELLQVKTVDNKLLVHAKHEESGGGRGYLYTCV